MTEIVGVDRDAAHNLEPVFLAPDTDVRINKNTSLLGQPVSSYLMN